MTHEEFLQHWGKADRNLSLISVEAAYGLGSLLGEITNLIDERGVEACFDDEIEAGVGTFELAEILDVTDCFLELLEFLIEGSRRGFWGWESEDNNITWVTPKL